MSSLLMNDVLERGSCLWVPLVQEIIAHVCNLAVLLLLFAFLLLPVV